MTDIYLLICYARSGGTLLNKYLSSRDDIYFLSEINPIGFGSGTLPSKNININNIIQYQMKEWYQIDLISDNFKDSLHEVIRLSKKNNKFLFVRDWSFINFYPRQENNFNPTKDFEFIKLLYSEKISFIPFVFIRNTIDVWISRNTPNLNIFTDAYYSYVLKILENKFTIFKYESFTKNPDKSYKTILNFLNIPYREIKKLNNNVFGDIQNVSKNNVLPKVIKNRRKIIKLNHINKAKAHKKFNQCNILLDYDLDYSKEKITFWNTTALFYFNKIRNKL